MCVCVCVYVCMYECARARPRACNIVLIVARIERNELDRYRQRFNQEVNKVNPTSFSDAFFLLLFLQRSI